MTTLPYPVYDADQHLYENPEAFLRHLPQAYAREFYFAEVRGRTKLVINGQLSEYIPNPTFAVVAAPGTHEKWYRAQNTEGLSMRELSGKPVAPAPEWRGTTGRLQALDQQGIHATLLFPTLASVIEARFDRKPEVISALLRSYNTWLIEDCGLAYEGRIFPVPMISLVDVPEAVSQLEMVIKAGARCVGVRPAPVPGLRGGRSPWSEEFDPFWARCAEARVFVCLHSSDSGYDQINQWWTAGSSEFLPFERDPFSVMIDYLGRPIADMVSSLVSHGALQRNPDLRFVSVENSADWIPPLLRRFDRVYGQMPTRFRQHPRDLFHKHFFVAPAYEDDMDELATLLPEERILFGSDFPHPEGLAEPLDYLKEFTAYPAAAVEKIFSTNLAGLIAGKVN
jgi:predicted TIM-barrel fold metal-dependent hydrolase